MQNAKPRDIALFVLNGYIDQSDSLKDYLDKILKKNSRLDSRDRAFINHLVFGVFRWRLRIDWIIGCFSKKPVNKTDLLILNILRLAVYQIFFLDRVPDSAAVNEAVEQVKSRKKIIHTVPFVNGVLRNICRHKDRIAFPDRKKDIALFLSVYYSFPMWLVNKWINELSISRTEELLAGLNNIPVMHIRTNSLKTNREDLLEKLVKEGVEAVPGRYSPEGIIIHRSREQVDKLKLFKKGMFQVQDEAAQIVSHLLDLQPGEQVLDICAGLGGKTSHISQLMKGRGLLVALDNNPGRLINLEKNILRLGFDKIPMVRADATHSLSSLLRCRFDRIMIDAPCSGLGTLSRHPDGKWNRDEDAILRLSGIQRMILQAASTVLRTGGSMLYVTCTVSREENEDVVHDFLKKNSRFRLVDLNRYIPVWARDLIDEQGFYRTSPAVHHMDGFFAALLRKHI